MNAIFYAFCFLSHLETGASFHGSLHAKFVSETIIKNYNKRLSQGTTFFQQVGKLPIFEKKKHFKKTSKESKQANTQSFSNPSTCKQSQH